MTNFTQFDERMSKYGWIVFDNVLDSAFVSRLNEDLAKAHQICHKYQEECFRKDMEGTAHHIVSMGKSFVEFLDKLPLREYLERYFGGAFILNSLGGSTNKKNNSSYACRVHRDIRTYSGNLNLMINTLVMLDDFTLENGATYVMSGSHMLEEKPSDEEFFSKADRITGKAGSILFFNSNIWHAAGTNTTDNVRRIITPLYTKPFMKQQYDYPRELGEDFGNKISPALRQLLGYDSRIPSNLSEWYYKKPEQRAYQLVQG